MKSVVAALICLSSWVLLSSGRAVAQSAGVEPVVAMQESAEAREPVAQGANLAADAAIPAPVGAALAVPGVFSQPKPRGVADFQAMQAHQRRLAAELRQATCTVLLEDGTGSAEFISPDGLMASAAHVTMEPGTEFTVVLADGRELKAVALTADTRLDGSFAMVLPGQINEPLPYLALAKRGEFKAGDWCMVCGNSGGWDAQRGSVIRVGRLVRATAEEIQSDTTLIGGDSGGPVVDVRGRFLGSNSRVGSTARFTLHVPLDYYLAMMPVALEQKAIVERDGVAGLRKSLAGDSDDGGKRAEESAGDSEAGDSEAGEESPSVESAKPEAAGKGNALERGGEASTRTAGPAELRVQADAEEVL